MVSTADVLEALKGIDFPKSKADVISYARSKNASRDVLDLLNRIPDQQFQNAGDILEAVGKVD